MTQYNMEFKMDFLGQRASWDKKCYFFLYVKKAQRREPRGRPKPNREEGDPSKPFRVQRGAARGRRRQRARRSASATRTRV